MAKNLVIYRPHGNIWFKQPIKHFIRGIKLPNKYGYLLDQMLASDIDLYFCSNIEPTANAREVFKRFVDYVELVLWCMIHRIFFKKIKLLHSVHQLNGKDAIFLMHYDNFTHEDANVASRGEKLALTLRQLAVPKIVHMTHYVYNSLIGKNNLEKLQPDYLLAENNLKNNSGFFNQYFTGIQSQFEALPYAAAARFRCVKPFVQRRNQLVATGSITYKMKDSEFTDFFKVDELQPLRRQLFDRAAEFLIEMDCQIMDLNATRRQPIEPGVAFQAKRYLGLLKQKLTGNSKMKAYYGKSIVDIYNDYQMFTVPEEACNLPAIGFVEGMACGCALFAIDDPMYRDIGLIPNIHYIAYDGTVDDLMEKVRYYQANSAALEAIAKSGREFVQENLRPEMIFNKFVNLLPFGSQH